MSDPHVVLGVAPGASPDELRGAYRSFVARHHPDHGGDPAVFIGGQAAYRQLLGSSSTPAADADLRFHRRSTISGRARRAVSVVSSVAKRLARQPVPPPRVR